MLAQDIYAPSSAIGWFVGTLLLSALVAYAVVWAVTYARTKDREQARERANSWRTVLWALPLVALVAVINPPS